MGPLALAVTIGLLVHYFFSTPTEKSLLELLITCYYDNVLIHYKSK